MNKQRKKLHQPAQIGRPRATRQSPTGPVREDILDAARTLFRAKGFKGTSTREIAEKAGLRQPSLFHYFKNKDEIFQTIVDGALQPPLAFIEKEKKRRLEPAVALYRFIQFDILHICTNENVIGSIGQFPELADVSQPDFFKLRNVIYDYIRSLLRKGIRSGVFHKQDLTILSHLVFGLLESFLDWNHISNEIDAQTIADDAALFILRSVLSESSKIDQIIEIAKSNSD